MSELISGKEAFDAKYSGVDVQWTFDDELDGWREWSDLKEFSIDQLKLGKYLFRLEPKTITINGIEVPAPFVPQHGDIVWIIDADEKKGYSSFHFLKPVHDWHLMQFGAWRTEEEINQVADAYRSVIKHD